jgi:hypothetical protein
MTGENFTMRKLLATISLVAIIVGCSSLPAKQVAVQSNRVAGQTIWALQDAERRLCNPASFDKDPLVPIRECVGPVAEAAKLTTENHRKFAAVLERAYTLRIRVDKALLSWQPGAPAPAELPGLRDAAAEALQLARALAQTPQQQQLVDLATTVVNEVQKIINVVRS